MENWNKAYQEALQILGNNPDEEEAYQEGLRAAQKPVRCGMCSINIDGPSVLAKNGKIMCTSCHELYQMAQAAKAGATIEPEDATAASNEMEQGEHLEPEVLTEGQVEGQKTDQRLNELLGSIQQPYQGMGQQRQSTSSYGIPSGPSTVDIDQALEVMKGALLNTESTYAAMPPASKAVPSWPPQVGGATPKSSQPTLGFNSQFHSSVPPPPPKAVAPEMQIKVLDQGPANVRGLPSMSARPMANQAKSAAAGKKISAADMAARFASGSFASPAASTSASASGSFGDADAASAQAQMQETEDFRDQMERNAQAHIKSSQGAVMETKEETKIDKLKANILKVAKGDSVVSEHVTGSTRFKKLKTSEDEMAALLCSLEEEHQEEVPVHEQVVAGNTQVEVVKVGRKFIIATNVSQQQREAGLGPTVDSNLGQLELNHFKALADRLGKPAQGTKALADRDASPSRANNMLPRKDASPESEPDEDEEANLKAAIEAFDKFKSKSKSSKKSSSSRAAYGDASDEYDSRRGGRDRRRHRDEDYYEESSRKRRRSYEDDYEEEHSSRRSRRHKDDSGVPRVLIEIPAREQEYSRRQHR